MQVFDVVTELAMVSPLGLSATADVTTNSQKLAQQLKDLLHKVCHSAANLAAPPPPHPCFPAYIQLIPALQSAARCLGPCHSCCKLKSIQDVHPPIQL